MNTDLTDITLVLDRSGSMQACAESTIAGVNTFLRDQRATPGSAKFSLVQFDNEYQSLYEGKDIRGALDLSGETFVPRGGTALLDAIGRTINRTGERLRALAEADRPGKVIFVIVTDGAENASEEFTREKVNEMIQHQRDRYQWDFVFIGANQDAIKTAAGMGIGAANSLTYVQNAVGTQSAFESLTRSVSNVRSGVVGSASFNAGDREAQKKAGA